MLQPPPRYRCASAACLSCRPPHPPSPPRPPRDASFSPPLFPFPFFSTPALFASDASPLRSFLPRCPSLLPSPQPPPLAASSPLLYQLFCPRLFRVTSPIPSHVETPSTPACRAPSHYPNVTPSPPDAEIRVTTRMSRCRDSLPPFHHPSFLSPPPPPPPSCSTILAHPLPFTHCLSSPSPLYSPLSSSFRVAHRTDTSPP